MNQIERALQVEIGWRLKALPVVHFAVPNGIYLPSRDPSEREMVARIVARMKSDGMLTPGAPDMAIAGRRGVVLSELKRPATRDLFARSPAGRLSDDQKAFRDRCAAVGVRYVVAYRWEDLAAAIEGIV